MRQNEYLWSKDIKDINVNCYWYGAFVHFSVKGIKLKTTYVAFDLLGFSPMGFDLHSFLPTLGFLFLFLPPHQWGRGGNIVIRLSVHPSVCSSIGLQNLTWKLNIFLLLLHLFSYKAHIWFEGTSHWYSSGGIKVKVICQGQGQLLRSHFEKKKKKKTVFGGISVSHTA